MRDRRIFHHSLCILVSFINLDSFVFILISFRLILIFAIHVFLSFVIQ